MLKFIIAARRKREHTQEQYFYEWGIIHVALMLSTPAVMKIFRKYVQHYSISGIKDDQLIHPLSDMEWDNMADHWVETRDDLVACVRVDDYIQRMRPHVFGDKAFVLQVTGGQVVHEQAGFRSGGVKLIHFLKKRPELSDEEFKAYWREQHAATVVNAIGKDRLRKYVQNPKLSLDPQFFKDTLFQMGGVNSYDGVEEFWFDNVDGVARLRNDPRIYDAWRASEARFVDADASFSMVTTERVVYDYTLGEKSSPRAAVLDPNSLEATVYRQGLSGWNIPHAMPDAA